MNQRMKSELDRLMRRKSTIAYQLYQVTQMKKRIIEQHEELLRIQAKTERKIKAINNILNENN